MKQEDKLWSALTPEEQQEYRNWYNESKSIEPLSEFDKGKLYAAEMFFGKHNLEQPSDFQDMPVLELKMNPFFNKPTPPMPSKKELETPWYRRYENNRRKKR